MRGSLRITLRTCLAYPFSALDKALGENTQRLEDWSGGRKISIRFDCEHRTAQAFDGSGREIPTVVGYWFAWYAFFPQTEVFTARWRCRSSAIELIEEVLDTPWSPGTGFPRPLRFSTCGIRVIFDHDSVPPQEPTIPGRHRAL